MAQQVAKEQEIHKETATSKGQGNNRIVNQTAIRAVMAMRVLVQAVMAERKRVWVNQVSVTAPVLDNPFGDG